MITDSIIAYGDQLGAQMSTFANLVYIAKENSTDICFFNEYKNFRRGYCLLKAFNLKHKIEGISIKFKRRFFLPIPELYCLQFNHKPKSVANYKRIYKSKLWGKFDNLFYRSIKKIFYADYKIINGTNGVNCDSQLLNLTSNRNYDIHSGFGTYQDWKKYENLIKNIFIFKDEIKKEASAIYNSIKTEKETLSIHFRKGDYLILSSLNLTLDYYQKALTYFNKDKYKLIIFSDDIDSCKNSGIFEGYDIHYMDQHSAVIDMCLMSLCDNNIIANSTFSFWGAFLNNNKNKKVVCPHDFIGDSAPEYMYINGNYYPEEWIAL